MLSLKKKMLMAGGVRLRPQDVFATSLYTGNGGTQDVINGFDYTKKRVLSWIKARSAARDHILTDSARGLNNVLSSSRTMAENGLFGPYSMTALANGKRIDSSSPDVNGSGVTYASFDFVEAKGFLSIVPYTGNGQSGRQIPHGLGDVPGMIVAKSRGAPDQGGADGFWFVYHRSLTTPQSGALFLNSTDARNGTGAWGNVSPTASTFTVSAQLNYPGREYVAYLFAHNPDLIDCGSFTYTGGAQVTCGTGWSPQFLLRKCVDQVDNWEFLDTARGWGIGNDKYLEVNTSGAEQTFARGQPTATGFAPEGIRTGPHIYLAIRSPT